MYLVGDVVKLKMPSKCRAQKAIIEEVVEIRIPHRDRPVEWIVVIYKICSVTTGATYRERIQDEDIEGFLCHREELPNGYYSD